MQWEYCLGQACLTWKPVALLGSYGNPGLGRKQCASLKTKVQSLGCPEAGTTSLLTVHCSWYSSLFSVYVHWEVGRRPRSVWSLYFLVCFLFAVLGIDLKGLVHSRQLSYHEAMTLILAYLLRAVSTFQIKRQLYRQLQMTWEMVEEITYRLCFECGLYSDHACWPLHREMCRRT